MNINESYVKEITCENMICGEKTNNLGKDQVQNQNACATRENVACKWSKMHTCKFPIM